MADYEAEALEYVQQEYPELRIVTKWEVCGNCRGNGSTSNHLGSFSPSDPNDREYLNDPDFMADYRAGYYDRTCTTCNGRTTVRAIDREGSDPEAIRHVDSYVQEAYDSDYIQAQEMRYC